MKFLKKSFALVATFLLFTVLMTSCGSTRATGCPGQDRPSFRGRYGMTHPTTTEFQARQSDKESSTLYNVNKISSLHDGFYF
jgi:hypothetical protein